MISHFSKSTTKIFFHEGCFFSYQGFRVFINPFKLCENKYMCMYIYFPGTDHFYIKSDYKQA